MNSEENSKKIPVWPICRSCIVNIRRYKETASAIHVVQWWQIINSKLVKNSSNHSWYNALTINLGISIHGYHFPDCPIVAFQGFFHSLLLIEESHQLQKYWNNTPGAFGRWVKSYFLLSFHHLRGFLTFKNTNSNSSKAKEMIQMFSTHTNW